MHSIASKLIEILDEGDVHIDEPMAAHTTFKIGGPADVLVRPRSVDQIMEVLQLCKQEGVAYRVIGLGSDLLVSDDGLRGVVIELNDNFNAISIEGSTMDVLAGASNADVSRAACEAGLTGYEFACGIPGTIGGAAIMNAGAYDGEFRDVCVSLECLTPEGELIDVSAQEADWSYRHSMMDEAGYIVISATLCLSEADPIDIQARIDDLTARREEKQPLEMPSAGSTFKRPTGFYASKLIDDSGLRGFTVGGAQVSTKHTGFLVNFDNATAADVMNLIGQVQDIVESKFGVRMQPEVRIWGFGD